MGDEMDLWYSPNPEMRSDLLKEFGFKEESLEILNDHHAPTGFPDALKTYKLMWEVYDLSLEEVYFWILDFLKGNFPIIDKLEDSFAAAENSAFFGVSQQRLGAQQDRVTNYLAQSGKMIKELFQMVRELRIIDERVNYYKDAEAQLEKPLEKRGTSAEITLKGIFIDLVQGGAKSAASIFGMAQQLEFITLPDLFFDAPPFSSVPELEKYVQDMEKNFNRSVLRVLERHLRQFHEWKKATYKEHQNRRKFMLQYLFQHFEIVKMYLNWIKPYLRHVSKLTLKGKNMNSADLITAFEGSMLDIEILARNRKVVGESGVSSCVLVTFNYRTRPELKVVQEGYQRGPVHIGQVEVHFRAYAWTDEEVENYKKLKEKETLKLFGKVSSAVEEAMKSLGEELDDYLKEARGEKEKTEKEEEKPERPKMAARLLGEFYRPSPKRPKKESYRPSPKRPKKESYKNKKKVAAEAEALKKAKKGQEGGAKFHAWLTYNTFMKSHGMTAF